MLMVNIGSFLQLLVTVELLLAACSMVSMSAMRTKWTCIARQRLSLFASRGAKSDQHEASVVPLSVCKWSRRRVIFSTLIAGVATVPLTSVAEKGAFEMDAEYYIKNLLGKNPSQSGSVLKNRPIYKSPRNLDPVFANEVVNIVANEIAELSQSPKSKLVETVNEQRPFFVNYFKTFAPLTTEDISDQYYFDMVMYIYYLEAAKLIPTSERRVDLRNAIGGGVLELVQKKYSGIADRDTLPTVASTALSEPKTANSMAKRMKLLGKGLQEILEVFKQKGIIADYELDVDDVADEEFARSSFQENLAVSFQVTLKDPATIIGFLQQAQANTFFHPEIVANSMVSYAKSLGFKARFEDYLMDNYYRTENRDVQAQDILLEFGILMS